VVRVMLQTIRLQTTPVVQVAVVQTRLWWALVMTSCLAMVLRAESQHHGLLMVVKAATAVAVVAVPVCGKRRLEQVEWQVLEQDLVVTLQLRALPQPVAARPRWVMRHSVRPKLEAR
jgi:hypothetical protein